MAPDCGSPKSWALKVSDIDSERMLLRIEQGKGRKGSLCKCFPQGGCWSCLRDWYRIARPAVWLFPGRDPLLPPLDDAPIQSRIVHAAADRASIKKRVTPHTLRQRHALPLTCSKRKTDVRLIQVFAPGTCQGRYHRALRPGRATNVIRTVMSPVGSAHAADTGMNKPPA